MGETNDNTVRVDFNRSLKINFRGATVSSDGGLLAYRELDDALGLTGSLMLKLEDARTGDNTRHALVSLIRQSIFSRIAGYADINDADHLRIDPVMRVVIGQRSPEDIAASKSTMHRFETEDLATDANLNVLMNVHGEWVQIAHKRSRHLKELILDMDGSGCETYGDQEGGNYNAYYRYTCFRPLFLFNQFGDAEYALLREGQVHDATSWEVALAPTVQRYKDYAIPKYFRGDAAFAMPALMDYLEENDFRYAIRIASNAVLERKVAPFLKRPVGRPPKKPKITYRSFQYRADSWSKERRIIAKIEWHAGELFPRVWLLVTNLSWTPKRIVAFYNKRGTAEQWIKEGKNAANWARLSCHDFKDNQVRLQLSVMAYNIGNFLRRLAMPREMRTWSLTTLLVKLVKIGAKVVSHSGYTCFQMAEVAVPRRMFASIVENIGRLRDSYG